VSIILPAVRTITGTASSSFACLPLVSIPSPATLRRLYRPADAIPPINVPLRNYHDRQTGSLIEPRARSVSLPTGARIVGY
jgi:hypothetical protein